MKSCDICAWYQGHALGKIGETLGEDVSAVAKNCVVVVIVELVYVIVIIVYAVNVVRVVDVVLIVSRSASELLASASRAAERRVASHVKDMVWTLVE